MTIPKEVTDMKKFPESDWKKLRKLEPTLLNKLFEIKLQKIRDLINDPTKTPEERYHGLHPLIKQSNRDIDASFDMRRSNMHLIAVSWYRLGLITKDDLESFSEDLKNTVLQFHEIF